MKEGQRRPACISHRAACFKHASRVATTDSRTALIASEFTLAKDRSPVATTAHVKCSVHKAATVHAWSFSIVDDTVSSMVKLALALRTGRAVQAFRLCLAEKIPSRL